MKIAAVVKYAAIGLGAFLVTAILAVIAGPIIFVLRDGPTFPDLTGNHQVGMLQVHLIDRTREEVFTGVSGDARELLVDLYYPADSRALERWSQEDQSAARSYVTNEQRGPLLGLPASVVRAIRPRRYRDAPSAAALGPFPLVVFSPGFNGLPVYYTSLLEQIASHGFVVAAVWHPYTTETTVFPDGRSVALNAAGSDDLYAPDPDVREAARDRIADVWLQDAQFVLDELLSGRIDEAPSGLIAPAPVTAIGHSFGGQNAAALLATDDRVALAINMDGSLIHEAIESNGLRGGRYALLASHVEPPYEYLERDGSSVAEWWDRWQRSNSPVGLDQTASWYEILHVPDATHDSFATDLALLKPMFPFVIPREMVGDADARLLLYDLVALVVAEAGGEARPPLALVENGIDRSGW